MAVCVSVYDDMALWLFLRPPQSSLIVSGVLNSIALLIYPLCARCKGELSISIIH